MKKYTPIALVVVSLFVFAGIASAHTKKDPFSEIWEAIIALGRRIDRISLTPGPIGPKGDTGAQGEPGPIGPQGDMGPQGPVGDTKEMTGLAYIDNFGRFATDLSGTYQDISGRNINYIKKEAGSILKITYQDQLQLSTQNSQPGYCSFRILIDNIVGQERIVGREIPNQNIVSNDPLSLVWLADNLPDGNHEIKIQIKRGWGSGPFEPGVCIVGQAGSIESSLGFLLVEEIVK